MTSLHLDPDDLAACVGCGLCLPHCPTYRATREEGLSPRGRIAGMREIQDREAPITARFVEMIDTCIQCRGCETACPSSVPYGRLVEGTIATLTEEGHETSPRWLRLALQPLRSPLVLGLGSKAIGLGQRLGLRTSKLGIPPLPLRQEPLIATGNDVWLHTGCVMDAWYRPVHQAVLDVLTAMGIGASLPDKGGACCGALHHHAGDQPSAVSLASRTMAAFPGSNPILLDSAGCGAAMKEYGDLLGTPEALAFSKRVFDIHEFIEQNADALPKVSTKAKWSGTVVVQDPCHLRHVQQTHDSVRSLLTRFGDVAVLDDEGLCCGAGGSFSLKHTELSSTIRERKHASIQRSKATIVASANPGCAGFLQPDGARTEHPMVLVAQALNDLPEPTQ